MSRARPGRLSGDWRDSGAVYHAPHCRGLDARLALRALMPVALRNATPSRFDGPAPRDRARFQLADAADRPAGHVRTIPGSNEARRSCTSWRTRCAITAHVEPHRLPMDEMEYTTLPQVMTRLAGRWRIFRSRRGRPGMPLLCWSPFSWGRLSLTRWGGFPAFCALADLKTRRVPEGASQSLPVRSWRAERVPLAAKFSPFCLSPCFSLALLAIWWSAAPTRPPGSKPAIASG